MGPAPWPYRSPDLDGAWRAIQDLRERLDGMQVADEVKQAVNQALDERAQLTLTRRQKWWAGGLALAVGLLPNIHEIVGWLS